MSCRIFPRCGSGGYVHADVEVFPKVKYHHEMSVMHGHHVEVIWTYEDYEVRESMTSAELIFDYQQLLIHAELI